MSEELKICEECGQFMPEQPDGLLHFQTGRGIMCQKFYNGIRNTTEIERVECPICLVRAAAPDLLEACEIMWAELVVCEEEGRRPSLKVAEIGKIETAIAKAKKE